MALSLKFNPDLGTSEKTKRPLPGTYTKSSEPSIRPPQSAPRTVLAAPFTNSFGEVSRNRTASGVKSCGRAPPTLVEDVLRDPPPAPDPPPLPGELETPVPLPAPVSPSATFAIREPP